MHEWVQKKGVLLRGGGTDESPHVYRRLPDVLEAQGATVEVLHTLRPLIVVMAGRTSSIRIRTEMQEKRAGGSASRHRTYFLFIAFNLRIA